MTDQYFNQLVTGLGYHQGRHQLSQLPVGKWETTVRRRLESICIGQYEENKYTALIQYPGHMVNLSETPFCQKLIVWAEFEWGQMEIVWQPSSPNGLLPNALNHIIDLISSYLALSLTDFALLLGSTTKSFKFMSLLSGVSGIPPPSFVFFFSFFFFFLQRLSSAIKTDSNGIKLAITLGPGWITHCHKWILLQWNEQNSRSRFAQMYKRLLKQVIVCV